MRQLILYYSRTNKNKRVCQDLKQALSCDMEEIVDQTDRQGIWNFIKAGFAAVTKKTTTIGPIKSNFAYYDMIILATMTPDMIFPSTACRVQKLIGASNAFAFDM